jgi:hypothetical protein
MDYMKINICYFRPGGSLRRLAKFLKWIYSFNAKIAKIFLADRLARRASRGMIII